MKTQLQIGQILMTGLVINFEFEIMYVLVIMNN